MPPLYALLMASPAVTSIIGDRVGAFGSIDANEKRPYITWGAAIAPQNQLTGPAPADVWSVQIEMNAKDQAQLAALAKAVREAIQSDSIVTAGQILGRDPTTGLFGFELSADFIQF